MKQKTSVLEMTGAGWCDIQIGNWCGFCSWVDDVPVILLEALRDAAEDYCIIPVEFDNEDCHYIILFRYSGGEILILEQTRADSHGRLEYNIVTHTGVCVLDIAEQLIFDIRHDIDRWVAWEPGVKDKESRKGYILSLCDSAEEVMKDREGESLREV
ncbi:MAG: hypothetical protein LIP11_15375 [Clostridiales bacterium]|nr:hypothetical protein [Clostridiales bacterium]